MFFFKYTFLIKPFIYISSWISFSLFFTNQVSEKINYKYFCFRIRGSRSTGTTESGIETISGVFVYFFHIIFRNNISCLPLDVNLYGSGVNCVRRVTTYCTFLPMLICTLLLDHSYSKWQHYKVHAMQIPAPQGCLYYSAVSKPNLATPLIMSPILYFWEISGFEPRELP